MKKIIKSFKIVFGILICCSMSSISFAQQNDLNKAKEIIQKVETLYETQKEYSVKVKYTMNDEKDKHTVLEAYEGVLMKRNKDFYSKIHHTETLQVNGEYIKVNHEEKALVYGKTNAEALKDNGINVGVLLQNFASATVDEHKDSYTIILNVPKVSQLPYYKVILEVDKNQEIIKKQQLFFFNSIPFKDASGNTKLVKPILNMVFNDFCTDEHTADKRFNIDSYIIKNKNKNRLVSALNGYQFIDTTIH